MYGAVQAQGEVWGGAAREEGLGTAVPQRSRPALLSLWCPLLSTSARPRLLPRWGLSPFLLFCLRFALLPFAASCLPTALIAARGRRRVYSAARNHSLVPKRGYVVGGGAGRPGALRREDEVAAVRHGQHPHVSACGGHHQRLAARAWAYAHHLGPEAPHVLPPNRSPHEQRQRVQRGRGCTRSCPSWRKKWSEAGASRAAVTGDCPGPSTVAEGARQQWHISGGRRPTTFPTCATLVLPRPCGLRPPLSID